MSASFNLSLQPTRLLFFAAQAYLTYTVQESGFQSAGVRERDTSRSAYCTLTCYLHFSDLITHWRFSACIPGRIRSVKCPYTMWKDRTSPASYSATLADTAVVYFPNEILDELLSFFDKFDLCQEERRQGFFSQWSHLLVLSSEHPELNLIAFRSSRRLLFRSDATVTKYRLLIVTLYAISRVRQDSWTCRTHALACIAWFIEWGPGFGVIVPLAEWATRPLFSNLLRVMAQSHEYYQDTSLCSVISFLLGQRLSGGICHVYETFRQERSLECIALHIWFIEELQGYITLLSKATNKSVAVNHTRIEPEALQSHIQDLHRAPVSLALCMSIALNSVPRRPVLSALAAISPDHPVWNMVLDIVKWHIDEDAFLQSYCSESRKVIPPGDALRLKKNLREVVDLLTRLCWQARRITIVGIATWVGG